MCVCKTSKSAQVRDLLRTPSTVAEVATILGVSRREAQVGVWVLTHKGQAKVCGVTPKLDWSGGHKTLKLYRLTRRGYYMLKRDKEKSKCQKYQLRKQFTAPNVG